VLGECHFKWLLTLTLRGPLKSAVAREQERQLSGRD
jgi:hypothetical protein